MDNKETLCKFEKNACTYREFVDSYAVSLGYDKAEYVWGYHDFPEIYCLAYNEPVPEDYEPCYFALFKNRKVIDLGTSSDFDYDKYKDYIHGGNLEMPEDVKK